MFMKDFFIRNALGYSLFFTVSLVHFSLNGSLSNAGTFALRQLKDSVYNLKEAIRVSKNQINNTSAITKEIERLQAHINALQSAAETSSLESQLTAAQDVLEQSMVALYLRAVSQGNNLFNRIYQILDEIYNDPFVKEKNQLIAGFQIDITRRLLSAPNNVNTWINQLHQVGEEIASLAPENIQATNTLLNQIKTEKIQQLSSTLPTNQESSKVRQQLYEKQLELQTAINDLPPSIKKQLQEKQDIIQTNNLILQYLEHPEKAAKITPESIAKQDNDSAFATAP